MIISEGPGEQEDRTGRPFQGPAGRTLNQILEAVPLSRDQVFITNTVCCRPPNNRDPFDPEVKACWPRLRSQIYLIDPDVIIAAGGVAPKALLRTRSFPITKRRGRLHIMDFPGAETTYPIVIMPVLHPSFVRRNMGLKKGGPVHRTITDIRLAVLTAHILGAVREGGLTNEWL